MIHEHSVEAFHAEEPRLSRRLERVIAWLELHPRKTDREIMQGLGFTDMNSVRPRVTEGIGAKRIVEVGERVCPVTQKRVRVVDLSLDERGRRQDVRLEASA